MTMSSIGGASGMSSTVLAQMREQQFKSLDTDKSGDINETEFAVGPSGSGGMDSDIASALFQTFDTDSSGGLSQDELETGFQKLSSSMRSVLIDTQDVAGKGGADRPDGPPPPPPASDNSGNSTSALDSLLSLLQGADDSDSSDDDSESSSTDANAVVKNDLKKLLEDLTKLTQNSGVGTQVTV